MHIDPGAPTPAGASGMDFVVPMAVVLGSYLFLLGFVALSPTSGVPIAPRDVTGSGRRPGGPLRPTSQTH